MPPGGGIAAYGFAGAMGGGMPPGGPCAPGPTRRRLSPVTGFFSTRWSSGTVMILLAVCSSMRAWPPLDSLIIPRYVLYGPRTMATDLPAKKSRPPRRPPLTALAPPAVLPLSSALSAGFILDGSGPLGLPPVGASGSTWLDCTTKMPPFSVYSRL